MLDVIRVDLTREEAEHLRTRCAESTNAPKVNGYSCGVCRVIGTKLSAALPKEGQGETEHRLSREDGERLEEIAARREAAPGANEAVAKSDAAYLRRLSQGILSGAVRGDTRVALEILALASFEGVPLPEDLVADPYIERGLLATSGDPSGEVRCDLTKAGLNFLAAALSQPPQDDVEGLREKLYRALTPHMPDHLLCSALADAFDAFKAPAPDVQRLGGDRLGHLRAAAEEACRVFDGLEDGIENSDVEAAHTLLATALQDLPGNQPKGAAVASAGGVVLTQEDIKEIESGGCVTKEAADGTRVNVVFD